jgi:Fe-coproporphyrin III synthase
MINVTRLLCGVPQPADALRYGVGAGAPRRAGERKPVVVWNITRRCNLRCVHCYSDSSSCVFSGELTTEECMRVIEDLAAFGVPGLLLSGGEPLIHRSFYEIARRARELKLRLTLSTNGTLIDSKVAAKLREIGFAYVGISLDGIGSTHDKFRGRIGAFDRAVAGFRCCRTMAQKVGLRLTLTRQTIADLDRILDFIEGEEIGRVCFYHLVYSGRGVHLALLRPEQTRQALDKIFSRVESWHRAGSAREVLTVGQPADGAYLLMRLAEAQPERYTDALKLLRWNGGGNHGSGVGIANIDTQGNVHPDQFWQTYILGNVRDKPFSRIWEEIDGPLIGGLRTYPRPVQGRCARCRFVDVCGGGFRVRAWQRFGDPWQEDPGCYLTDGEIADPNSN